MWTANLIYLWLIKSEQLCGLNKNGVVDLGNAGRYWEGGVLNSCERFGYGKEYNEENNIVYEEFMFGDRRICHGKEYRGVYDKNGRNRLVYDGEYCDGVRYGYGKSYDLNGEVEYEGEWIDNIPIHEI